MIAEISIRHTIGNNDFEYNCVIEEGITGVFGPSGAGKTTFLNLLAGIEHPDEGVIKLNNQLVFDKKNKVNIPETKRDIGYVFQDGRLFPHLSVVKNLCYSKPYIKNKKKRITLAQIVALLDLEALLEKMPRQLSGGERQRVAIGRALLSQPSFLLLDEPFSNLDRELRKKIISYLLKINSTLSMPMLIVSHDFGDILRLTKKILTIKKGSIIGNGNIFSSIKESLASGLVQADSYLNIFDAQLEKYSKDEKLYIFSHLDYKETKLAMSSKIVHHLREGTKIRFAIKPDDIALSKHELRDISIRNQLKGVVKKIITTDVTTICVVDCGVDLMVEITEASLIKMNIKTGQPIYCLIKAKAVELIHVFIE